MRLVITFGEMIYASKENVLFVRILYYKHYNLCYNDNYRKMKGVFIMMTNKLFFNGDILTMDETALYVDAVLVQNGKIAKIGSKDALAAMAPDAEMVDLQGKTLMPAFIDPHGHFTGYASATLQANLTECVNYSDVIVCLKRFIQDNHLKPGEWIVAQGYDHNLFEEKEHPKRDVLDQGAPENPVLCQHKSGHTGCLNSMALELLNITPDTEAPEGGRIEVEDGRVTGYMEETALMKYQKMLPMKDMSEFMAAYTTVQDRYAAYGITTVQEGMFVDEMKDLYIFLANSGMLKLDIVVYLDMACKEETKQAFADSWKQYHNHVKMGGYKIFLDGSPQARTAWMRTPYVDAPDYFGYPVHQDQAVVEMCKKALQDDIQLLAHCNGDAASQQYLDSFQKAKAELNAQNDIRPVIVHAQLLGIDQLPAVKKLGMIPTFFVAHTWYWGDTHLKNFGERAKQVSPAGSALKSGIPFTFHQDPPVINPDMLETVWCAVNRMTKNGADIGAAERIPVLEALKAVTINGAYQYGEEDSKGTISEGKRADLIILDQNPLKVDPLIIRDLQVLETMKDGETVFQRA